MGVSKTITIDGVDVQFKASAAIPRLYRLQFRRDLFHDFADLQKSVDDEKEKDSEASGLNPEILETFENVAYMMASMQTLKAYREQRRNGWNSSPCFQFMKFCQNCWNFGTQTCKHKSSLKKTSPD